MVPKCIVQRERKEKLFHGKISCAETIYRSIYSTAKDKNKTIYDLICFLKKTRQNRKKIKKRRGEIKDRVFVDKREIMMVELRCRIGDREVYTMETKNHKGYMMVERCFRFPMTALLPSKNKHLCADLIIQLLSPSAKLNMVKTISFNNGKEFAFYKKLAEHLNTHKYTGIFLSSLFRLGKSHY